MTVQVWPVHITGWLKLFMKHDFDQSANVSQRVMVAHRQALPQPARTSIEHPEYSQAMWSSAVTGAGTAYTNTARPLRRFGRGATSDGSKAHNANVPATSPVMSACFSAMSRRWCPQTLVWDTRCL
jgi:hypothetical protein